MKVDLKGQLMEKFSKKGESKDGTKFEKLFLRIYQPGQRMNIDVHVDSEKFMLYDLGEQVHLEDVSLSTFNNMIFARAVSE